jgi:glycogen operon protein
VVSPVAGRLILDSLRYWADEMGVDGFRFDLAPVLGNTIASGGFRYAIGSENNLLRRIATELPRRSDATPTGVDLIAEPWATGSGNTYQLGQFPDGWSEWNDVYRIAARQFENKLGVIDLPAHRIANIVSGSEAQFHHASPRKNPRPWNSVNYVDSHDGYTLRDVFSFTGDGDVWNHAGDPVRQRKAVRNAIALLMTSAGVPMIAGGDELFRTLGGSVGVAATDDATVHLDWKTWNCRNRGMERGDLGSIERCALDDSIRAYRFMRFMIELRTRFPWLRPDHYFTGATVIGLGIKDIAWYRSDGDELSGADWTGPRFLAWRIANRGYRQAGDIGSTLVAYNWSDGFIDCRLPRPMEGMRWRRQADTAEWFEYTANIDTSATEIEGRYGMYERSIVVLFEE